MSCQAATVVGSTSNVAGLSKAREVRTLLWLMHQPLAQNALLQLRSGYAANVHSHAAWKGGLFLLAAALHVLCQAVAGVDLAILPPAALPSSSKVSTTCSGYVTMQLFIEVMQTWSSVCVHQFSSTLFI